MNPDDPNPQDVPNLMTSRSEKRGGGSLAGGCLKIFLWTTGILFVGALALFGLILFMCSRH